MERKQSLLGDTNKGGQNERETLHTMMLPCICCDEKKRGRAWFYKAGQHLNAEISLGS